MGSNGDSIVECSTKFYKARQTVNLKEVENIVDVNEEIKFPRFQSADDSRPIFFEMRLSPSFHQRSLPDARGRSEVLAGFNVGLTAFNDDSDDPEKGLPPTIFVRAVRIRQRYYEEHIENATREFPHHRPPGLLPWKTCQHVRFLYEIDAFMDDNYVPPESWQVSWEVEYGIMITEDNSSIPSVTESQATVDLVTDLLALLESGDGADFHFIVAGERIPAHRLILSARSDYFRSLLRSGMLEADTGETTVIDCRPEDIKDILRAIYGGKVRADMTSEDAMSVLPVADKYCLDLVRDACADVLLRNLTPDNVCLALLLADLHNCARLKVRCLTIIKRHYIDCSSSYEELQSKAGWRAVKNNTNLHAELLMFLSKA